MRSLSGSPTYFWKRQAEQGTKQVHTLAERPTVRSEGTERVGDVWTYWIVISSYRQSLPISHRYGGNSFQRYFVAIGFYSYNIQQSWSSNDLAKKTMIQHLERGLQKALQIQSNLIHQASVCVTSLQEYTLLLSEASSYHEAVFLQGFCRKCVGQICPPAEALPVLSPCKVDFKWSIDFPIDLQVRWDILFNFQKAQEWEHYQLR